MLDLVIRFIGKILWVEAYGIQSHRLLFKRESF